MHELILVYQQSSDDTVVWCSIKIHITKLLFHPQINNWNFSKFLVIISVFLISISYQFCFRMIQCGQFICLFLFLLAFWLYIVVPCIANFLASLCSLPIKYQKCFSDSPNSPNYPQLFQTVTYMGLSLMIGKLVYQLISIKGVVHYLFNSKWYTDKFGPFIL